MDVVTGWRMFMRGVDVVYTIQRIIRLRCNSRQMDSYRQGKALSGFLLYVSPNTNHLRIHHRVQGVQLCLLDEVLIRRLLEH